MSTPVSEREPLSEEHAGSERSPVINWPALYVMGGLMLVAIAGSIWMGAYETAATTGLLLGGGALFLMGNVQKELGNESRYWRWSGYAAYAVVGIWSLIRLAQAWMAHSGS